MFQPITSSPDPFQQPNINSSPSLNQSLSKYIVSVESSGDDDRAAAVNTIIENIRQLVHDKGLEHELDFDSVEGLHELGIITLRCSSRLREHIEEIPGVSRIDNDSEVFAFF
jgi:hypothetical protein